MSIETFAQLLPVLKTPKLGLRDVQIFDLQEFAERYGQTEHPLLRLTEALIPGSWIAGGAVRDFIQGSPIRKDVDYFFDGDATYRKFLLEHYDRDLNEFKHHTSWLDDDDLKHQAIKVRWYTSPLEVIDSFDFTLCMAATDGKNLWLGPYTLFDIARKRLAVNKVTYAVATMRRCFKYMSYGFTACDGTLATLLTLSKDAPFSEVLYVD
jgi:hypothetical protein